MSAAVADLLKAWGLWRRKQQDQGSGYPKEVAWIKERVQESRSASDFIGPTDQEILHIERLLMAEPPAVPDPQRKVLVFHYYSRGSAPVKAEYLGMPERRYFEALKVGQVALEAALNAIAVLRSR